MNNIVKPLIVLSMFFVAGCNAESGSNLAVEVVPGNPSIGVPKHVKITCKEKQPVIIQSIFINNSKKIEYFPGFGFIPRLDPNGWGWESKEEYSERAQTNDWPNDMADKTPSEFICNMGDSAKILARYGETIEVKVNTKNYGSSTYRF